jgi:RNA 3'-terminal phosphate cyclase (ATP)
VEAMAESNKDWIIIDGSQGEGGGQILRSSVALSMVSGNPIRIERIRAGREKPGLLRQHLTALLAARDISTASLVGAEFGSKQIEFIPGEVRGGHYQFSVGSAGSATLVLQTVLPPLMLAQQPSQLILSGGTHNPWAPPFDFLAKSYLPLVSQLGPKFSANLNRYGFYPAGGGEFSISIQPATRWNPFDLVSRGKLLEQFVSALVVDLPIDIGHRELDKTLRSLGWKKNQGQIDQRTNAGGPGNVLTVHCHYENVNTIFTAFGRKGFPAESVAQDVVKQFRAYEKHQAVLDEYLCDQWMLPLAIAVAQSSKPTSFRTGPLSRHSQTHREIIQRFLPVQFDIVADGSSTLVRCEPQLKSE